MSIKIEFSRCVLCDAPLNASPSWRNLLDNRFTQSKCNRCTNQFVRLAETIDGIYCLYEYNDAMQEYFQRLKFMKDVYVVYAFHEEVFEALSPFAKQKNTSIVPIPMHPKNLRNRTFAQVEELLKAAQIPFHQALIKTTSEQQSKKSRKERLAVKNLFEVQCVTNSKHYVIFDDIKTTGVTLHLARQALIDAGANEVTLVALAGGTLK